VEKSPGGGGEDIREKPPILALRNPNLHSTGQAGEPEGEKDFLEDSRRIIRDLEREGYPIEILFLESSDPFS